MSNKYSQTDCQLVNDNKKCIVIDIFSVITRYSK